MINSVLNALAEKDSTALAACFSEDCTYFDYCPPLHNRPGFFVYGRPGLDMFFKKLFFSGAFEAYEPLKEDERNGCFFGAYYGPFISARLTVEELSDDGLIKRAVVRPA